ncbi:MAG: hypothetical protein HY225_03680 [Candidatus Vogelbacteria bacterium]|nr:hypothetical protein [Candidatus Vogelbacteria bacterium]
MEGVDIGTTSFIPKKSLAPRSGFTTNLPGIFLFLSIALLIFSIGGYFVAVLREKSILQDTENLKVILKQAQDQFQPGQVVNMARFDSKLKIAKDLIYLSHDPRNPDTTMHVTLQPLFDLLSQKTLKSVRFRDFKYTNADNQKIEIRMSGEAKSIGSVANYAAVAQQARVFSDSGELMDVIVSDLNLGTNNNVVFNLTATVKPELVSYSEFILNSETTTK